MSSFEREANRKLNELNELAYVKTAEFQDFWDKVLNFIDDEISNIRSMEIKSSDWRLGAIEALLVLKVKPFKRLVKLENEVANQKQVMSRIEELNRVHQIPDG